MQANLLLNGNCCVPRLATIGRCDGASPGCHGSYQSGAVYGGNSGIAGVPSGLVGHVDAGVVGVGGRC